MTCWIAWTNTLYSHFTSVVLLTWSTSTPIIAYYIVSVCCHPLQTVTIYSKNGKNIASNPAKKIEITNWTCHLGGIEYNIRSAEIVIIRTDTSCVLRTRVHTPMIVVRFIQFQSLVIKTNEFDFNLKWLALAMTLNEDMSQSDTVRLLFVDADDDDDYTHVIMMTVN